MVAFPIPAANQQAMKIITGVNLLHINDNRINLQVVLSLDGDPFVVDNFGSNKTLHELTLAFQNIRKMIGKPLSICHYERGLIFVTPEGESFRFWLDGAPCLGL